MVEYKCLKCGKTFNHKGTYDNHMNRKTNCGNQIANNDNTCKNCGKKFSCYNSLYSHTKNSPCNEKCTNINNNINTNNTNIENMNVDGDVKVVKFGDENLTYISDDIYKKIIGRGFKCLEEFVMHVFFNKDHPENHNVYVSNLNKNIVNLFNGETWDSVPGDEFFESFINDKADFLEDKYDDIKDSMIPPHKKKFNNFYNRKDDQKISSKLQKELRYQFYNNRHMVKETRKTLELQKDIPKTVIEDKKSSDNRELLLNAIKNMDDKDLSKYVDLIISNK